MSFVSHVAATNEFQIKRDKYDSLVWCKQLIELSHYYKQQNGWNHDTIANSTNRVKIYSIRLIILISSYITSNYFLLKFIVTSDFP